MGATTTTTSGINNAIIIGKIPGYNSVVDPKGYFSKQLLRDVTYIDLFPATFSLNTSSLDTTMKLLAGQTTLSDGIDKIFNEAYLYKYTSGKQSLTHGIFKSVLINIAEDLRKTWAELDIAQDTVGLSNEDYKSKVISLINDFTASDAIRIIAANDSTFTETISNNFSDNSVLDQLAEAAFLKGGGVAQGVAKITSNLQKLSYNAAMDALSTFSTRSSLFDVLTGKALGIQFSSPKVWMDSNYASTLSLFIKLASPSGHPLDVFENIVLPIMALMGAGAPLTKTGVSYGFPLLWDVRAYGITRFKVGALAAMTISRGSYETVFNYNKQPLVVDVRLNIIPLIQDFAVKHSYSGQRDAIQNVLSSGTSGTSTTGSVSEMFQDTINNTVASFTAVLESVTASASETVNENVYKKLNPILSVNGRDLGVQSPVEEMNGLIGFSEKFGGVSYSSVEPRIPKEVYNFSI